MEKLNLHRVNCAPANLRKRYLDSLPHSQEYFLEQLVNTGDFFEILGSSGGPEGYIVVSASHIVEVFLESPSEQLLNQAISEVVGALNIKKMYIKSFDPMIAYLSSNLMIDSKIDGYLFRQHLNVNFDKKLDLLVSNLDSSETAEIMAMNDGFFEDETEAKNYIDNDALFAYRNRAGDLIACGILSRVIEGRSAVDIGMLVDAKHRNHGFGGYVANHLKNLCQERGDQPIAGCSAENISSKRALEAAGFVSEHQLLELNLCQ